MAVVKGEGMPDQTSPPLVFYRWLGLSVLIVVLDQASKLWVMQHFYHGELLELTRFLNLTLAFNPGAAFSFLAGAGGWQKWFFLGLAIMVSAWILLKLRQEPQKNRQALSLSLIMAGAMGNAVDRVIYGAVVDFVDVYWRHWHWPAFNVADSAICVGAALLLWDQLRQPSVKVGHEQPGR